MNMLLKYLLGFSFMRTLWVFLWGFPNGIHHGRWHWDLLI
jgi:hypothetical protein